VCERERERYVCECVRYVCECASVRARVCVRYVCVCMYVCVRMYVCMCVCARSHLSK